jgi:nickel-dependent lactate racemase
MNVYKGYYKGEPIDFEVPSGWTVIGVGEPKHAPPLPDVRVAVQRALEHPVGAPSVTSLAASAEKAVVICDDQTRPTPAHQLLPGILDRLNSVGIPDRRVTVVVGRGTHRRPTDAEVKAKVGGEVLDRVAVEVHDPDAKPALKYIGVSSRGTPIWINRTVAEADLIIGVGNVAPHYFAGYGGGGKIILPGVAGRETIVRNHVLIRDPNTIQGKLEENIVYTDMREVARKAGLALKIDVVLNMANEVAGISAGEVGAEHKQGIEMFNAIYGFRPPRPADVTITCGYPLESNLIQSNKAVMSADLVTKKGGIILLVSACYDGPGHGFYETLRERPEPDEVIDWMAVGKALPSGGPVANRVRGILKTKTVAVVTDGVSHEQLKEMEMLPFSTVQDALDEIAWSRKSAEVMIFPAGSSINPML